MVQDRAEESTERMNATAFDKLLTRTAGAPPGWTAATLLPAADEAMTAAFHQVQYPTCPRYPRQRSQKMISTTLGRDLNAILNA